MTAIRKENEAPMTQGPKSGRQQPPNEGVARTYPGSAQRDSGWLCATSRLLPHRLFSAMRCATVTTMPRDGAIVFGDLIGKLDVLRIECPKCGRSGRYRLADLLMRYGRNERVFAFTDDVTANCTRRQARSDNDPCGASS